MTARASILAWDVKNAVRALLVAAVAFVVVWLATAASDEGGVAWAVRAGRSLPGLPVCAAFGTWLSLFGRRAREETLALESLGRTPAANALGAAVGGAALAVVASMVVASVPAIDVSGFYPVATRPPDVRLEGDAFVDRDHGLRIGADGAIAPLAATETKTAAPAPTSTSTAARAPEAPTAPRGPAHARALAAASLALAGIALPLVSASARRRTAPTAIAVCFAVGVASVLAFHAVAAGTLASIVALAPAILLLAYAVFRYVRFAWDT